MALHPRKVSESKKQRLLALAKQGSKRPPSNAPLAKVLGLYTSPGAHSYDREFTEAIKRIAPDWFHDSRMARNKGLLLELALQGAARPNKATRLGIALKHYIDRTGDSYDRQFTIRIMALAPHSWWSKHTQRRLSKKRIAKR